MDIPIFPQVHLALNCGALLSSHPDPLMIVLSAGLEYDKCAVEEAVSRGPDFASIAVKLFEYAHDVRTSGSYSTQYEKDIALIESISTLVSSNHMDDHSVSSVP